MSDPKRRALDIEVQQAPGEREVRIILTADTVAHADDLFEMICAGVRNSKVEIDLGVVLTVNDGLGVLQ